jgi:hypothetical protein
MGEHATEVAERCDNIEKNFQTRTREIQVELDRLNSENLQLQKKLSEVEARPAATLVPNEVNNDTRPLPDNDAAQQVADFKNSTGDFLHELARENLRLTCSLDTQEQYERRDTVIVHNVREMRTCIIVG